MPRKPSLQPNEVELRILNVLWDRGPSTAREIHEAMLDERPTGITSTTKMLQYMEEKGLVTRDASDRPIRYAAAAPREATQGSIVGDVIDRVFGGAAEKLILRAVQTRKLSADQLAEIRRYINRMEGKGR
jgi:predicted transcriptional regulator